MKKRSKRPSVWSDQYRPYGTTNVQGDPWEWANAFKTRFSDVEIHTIIGEDDPWGILGLKPGATQDEIKTAFRKKAIETHPDRNPGMDGSAFRRVKAAFDKIYV
jgi:DnaJ-class molecular chaperone